MEKPDPAVADKGEWKPMVDTTLTTSISHLGKKNNIFKSDLEGAMLVSGRVDERPLAAFADGVLRWIS